MGAPSSLDVVFYLVICWWAFTLFLVFKIGSLTGYPYTYILVHKWALFVGWVPESIDYLVKGYVYGADKMGLLCVHYIFYMLTDWKM